MSRISVASPSRIKPARWAISPGLVDPQWRWAWRGLKAAIVNWEGGGPPYDFVQRILLTKITSTGIWSPQARGLSLHHDAVTSDASWDWNDEDFIPTDRVTVLVHKHKDDATSRASSGFGVSNTSGNTTERCGAHIPWSDGTVYFDFGGTGASNRISIGSLTFGDDIWVMRAGPQGMQIWQNGILRAENTSISPTRVNSVNPFRLGSGNTTMPDSPVSSDLAKFSLLLLWDYELNNDAIVVISRDPFGPFRLARRRIAAAAFNGALMAAMDRPWPDIIHRKPEVVASGMTPPGHNN